MSRRRNRRNARARARRRFLRLTAISTGLSLLGTAAAVAITRRRWASTVDGAGANPLGVPEMSKRRITSHDGAELHLLVAEPAADATDVRTVVLPHCWTGDHRVWGPVTHRLVERGHRVVLYDQRGHGASTAGSDGYTLEALAGDLRAVIEHIHEDDDMHADEVVLGGHSMGGMTIQAFAGAHPEVLEARVSGVVLVATASTSLRANPRAEAYGRAAIGHPRLTSAMASGMLGPVLVRRTIGRKASLASLLATAETFAKTPGPARAAFLAAMLEMDLREGLANIDVPTRIIVGTRDNLTPVDAGRTLAELIPHARLDIVPDAGHMLPFEEPDRVADLIEEVINESAKVLD